MKVLKKGANVMKHVHKEANIDNLENTILDIQEQMDITKELTAALNQPLDNGIGDDTEDILNELETMKTKSIENELLNSKIPSSSVIKIPNPPPPSPKIKQIPIVQLSEDDIMMQEASLL
jgi:charged multivesicular body protein 4